MEQKDIDRLFQEKLKDVEVTPNPAVWNAIEKKLQKKKRRIIPIWWFSGGVAAILLLGVFLFFNNKGGQQKDDFPTITKDEVTREHNTSEDVEKKEDIVTPSVIVEKKEEKNSLLHNIDVAEKQKTKNSEKIIKTKGQQITVATNDNVQRVNKKELDLIDSKIAVNKEDNNSEEGIKNNPSSDEIVVKNNLKFQQEEENINKEIQIAKKENNTSDDDEKDFPLLEKENLNKETDIPKKNFIAEMNKKNEEPREVENQEKWAVSPVVGILKSNSFSKGSPLDADLNNNDISGGSTFSYGVNVTYQLRKKWALRSGIQLQRTVFTTNDVNLISSSVVVANSLENVVVNSSNSNDVTLAPGINNDLSSEFVINGDIGEEGNLQQNYSYIEIPVEVKYTFLTSKRVSTSIITGFSSLILNENNIVSETSNFSSTIGGATNLNTLNFSGNLGFDVDISIAKKLNLNINPVFKAQLNTFSENSNGFSPYAIGVYTGLRYKF